MNDIVSLFRRRDSSSEKFTAAPRHRREGFFDDQDQWHDATETPVAAHG
jgi:hypothetical protein